jgi:hypothetical protein
VFNRRRNVFNCLQRVVDLGKILRQGSQVAEREPIF